MTDHQTLDWLLTKLRNAESLNDWYAQRIGELEAKPASPWRLPPNGETVGETPPDSVAVLLRCVSTGQVSGYVFYRVAKWSAATRMFWSDSTATAVPNEQITGWMPIPECDQ